MIKKVMTVCLCVVPIVAFGMTSDQSSSQSQWGSSSAPQSNGTMSAEQSTSAGQTVQLDSLIGKTVMDSQQKEVGKIQDFVVNTQDNKALYSVVGAGGFLGVGEDYHAVPWSAMHIQKSGDTIQSVSVSTDADTIKNSPKIEMGAGRSFSSSLSSQVNSYYQGKGIQTDGMSTGTQGMSGGTSSTEQYPSNGTAGTRPSGMTGTSTQNQQFNTAQPQSESIYGDGVRSGKNQTDTGTKGTEPNQTMSPFGTSSSSSSDGTSPDPERTATEYRSGYADGVNRTTSPESTRSSAAAGQSVSSAEGSLAFFSNLSGREVKDAQDQKLGSIKDLVVDAKRGNVLFGLISMDDKLVAVPWNSLQPAGQNAYSVNIEKNTLQTLAFKSDNKPDFSDPSYQQRIYQQFGQQPPTVYGYVSPEGTAAGIGAAAGRDSSDMEYTGQFDPKKLETITGKIKEVKSEKEAMKGESRQARGTMRQERPLDVKIETTEGQTLDVHAAPEQFLKQHDMELKKDETITVTGCKATVNGKQVFIASKITANGKEVMLRSAQGQPMWTSGQMGSQMRSGRSSGQTDGMSNGTSSDGMSGGQSQSSKSLSAEEITSGSSSQTGSYGSGSTSSQTDGMSGSSSQTDSSGSMTDSQSRTSGLSGQSMQFKADEQTTVSGTVQSTETGTMPVTMGEAVLLKVQTDQGQTTTIYAGPRSYLQERNMSFSSGDKIKATGWKKTLAGKEVFIASQIEKDGQTLQLRDSSGTPMWKQQEGSGSSYYNRMESGSRSGQTGSGSSSSSGSTTY